MSSSIPSWQILTAHANPFRGARDLAFCLKVPLDLLLVWAGSEGSGETARMRRLAWTFATRIGDKYQIYLTRSNSYHWYWMLLFLKFWSQTASILGNQLGRLMTKQTKWYVCPAKTQISLGIRTVWSESSLSAWRQAWVFSYPLSAPWRLWSDWPDAQADLSLRWALMSLCWFCRAAAHLR